MSANEAVAVEFAFVRVPVILRQGYGMSSHYAEIAL